jgi:prepilin-type N-terminal cleavage/methylation domain-containing protein
MIKRGFTLIETVVVIAISVMALLALVNLFIVFNSIYGYQNAFIAAAGSAGGSMNSLEAYVSQAENVLASRTVSGTSYSSGTSTLVLEIPSIDSSGNALPSAKDYVVFHASGTVLYRIVAADNQSSRLSGQKQMSGTLSSLSLTYDDSDFTQVTNIVVDIRTQAVYKQQIVQSRLIEQLYLRNFYPL